MLKKFPDSNVMKLEWPIFDPDSFNRSLKPVIITRDKIEFLWSMRHYFNLQSIPYDKFLELPMHGWNMKGVKIIDMIDYERWIEPFRVLDPIVMKFEDMIKLDDFPHNEITRTRNKPDIPKEFIELVNSSI